jgi:hypothetical protein
MVVSEGDGYVDTLHFEGFKVGAHHPIIAEFDAIVTNAAMQSWFSPKRWQMEIDAMLIKEEGVTLIENLRIIIMFMVDYNYMNNHIGRTIMSNAERYRQLSMSYGTIWKPQGKCSYYASMQH